MDRKKPETLLTISPHFEVFIRDQVTHLRPYFKEITALIPIPYFLGAVSRMPVLGRRFDCLGGSLRSCNESLPGITIIPSKFLTLPIEVLRKRNFYISSKSCIKTVSRSSVSFDLIHSYFVENGFTGAKLKNLYGKPFVLTVPGGDAYEQPFLDSWYNALARYVLGEADEIITVSQFNAKHLLSVGVSQSRLHVIPNGYDERLFKPGATFEAREKLGLPLQKKILLTVGNLVAIKGHTYLLDAMKLVLRERRDVLLVIVGAGSLSEVLGRKVAELKLEKNVLFVGWKEHGEIPAWISACDVFVFPSLNESFGVAVIEAMACGKPVVGTCVGGLPEIVRRDDVGILVKPADPKSLSEGILEALNKNWETGVITEFSRQYSFANIAEKIIRVYAKAFENRKSKGK